MFSSFKWNRDNHFSYDNTNEKPQIGDQYVVIKHGCWTSADGGKEWFPFIKDKCFTILDFIRKSRLADSYLRIQPEGIDGGPFHQPITKYNAIFFLVRRGNKFYSQKICMENKQSD